jgi:diguanylate cyclase (GGDEF)-like protein
VKSAPEDQSGQGPSLFVAGIKRNLLRAMLGAGAILLCVLISLILIVDEIHDREVAVTVASRAAANLAGSLAQQASDTFEATNCALFGLGERAAGGPAPGGSLSEWMAMQVVMVPRLHQLLVVDKGGRVRASSDGDAPELSAGNLRELITYHRARPDSGLYLSGPTRNGPGTNWLISASRRFDGADGRFAGVVVSELEVNYFERLYRNVDVGARGTISLVSDRGIIVVRKPFAFIGSAFRAPALTEASRSSPAGLITWPLDGIARLNAFQRLPDYPFAIWVSVPQDDVLAQWRSAAQANGIAIMIMVTMIGLLATGLGMQIEKRKQAEEALARLALLDGLTGLANRRRFDSALESEWERAHRAGSTLALLMIDVDHFKAYNDQYGHPCGDKILTAIAQTIVACALRGGDLTARYGGEEFAVIVPSTPAAHAVEIAERIRTAVADLKVPHIGGATGVVTVSIGVAALEPRTPGTNAELLHHADAALYESKSAGRNRWSLFDESALARSNRTYA